MDEDPCPPVLVEVTRDDVVESVHRGHVALCTMGGETVRAVGDPDAVVYVRSTIKPFQALATLEAAEAAGIVLDSAALAIACASHRGSDDHQIEAARILALAGLDEDALLCPPALPDEQSADFGEVLRPSRLAHNCSGKHAGFLLAQVAAGRDPSGYLAVDGQLHVRIAELLAESTASTPVGPGVDGCGAPAWRLPLSGLATGFARLAAGADERLRRVRDAMHARPELVGGWDTPDTALMMADGRVVAKRGAEGLLAAGVLTDRGPIGVAVKIDDGTARATGPVIATLLAELGIDVPVAVRTPVVLGGGQPHGVVRSVARLRGLV
jgi:L-asparaginase II